MLRRDFLKSIATTFALAAVPVTPMLTGFNAVEPWAETIRPTGDAAATAALFTNSKLRRLIIEMYYSPEGIDGEHATIDEFWAKLREFDAKHHQHLVNNHHKYSDQIGKPTVGWVARLEAGDREWVANGFLPKLWENDRI